MTRIWFPDFYTEAHRSFSRGQELADAFLDLGVECVTELDKRCDAVFCGSVYKAEQVRTADVGNRPVVHYSWDIYPFQLQGADKARLWDPYLEDLHKAAAVVVPSKCSVDRVREFTGRDAVVVKSAVKVWESELWNPDHRPYVLDVMRKYPDPNAHAVRDACLEVGVACVESNCALDWDNFKKLVKNAALLVSAYYEASTGGLTLLEGYYHGVPVLLSDSPRNGGRDYFVDRAAYFDHNSLQDLIDKVSTHLKCQQPLDDSYRSEWVLKEYSEARMAKELIQVIQRTFLG